MDIRAASFDLWQTLIFDNRSLGKERDRLRLEGMGKILDETCPVNYEALAQAYHRCGQRLVEVQAQQEDMDTSAQVSFLLRCLPGEFGWVLDHEETFERLVRAYVEPVLAVPPVLGAGSRETLAWLKEEGYRIALVSNTGRTPGYMSRQLLRQLGIPHFFDVLVFSNELGYTKPHPSIFQVALQGLGLEAPQVVHIGDNPTTDLWGAKRAGMKAVLLNEGLGEAPWGIFPDARIQDILELKQVLRRWRTG